MKDVNFYTDHPHHIRRICDPEKDWIEKSVSDELVLERELFIQRALAETGCVPQCGAMMGKSFTEEFIEGHLLATIEDVDTWLESLALTLQSLHQASECLVNEVLFSHSIFLPEYQYNPRRVMEGLLRHVRNPKTLGLNEDLLHASLVGVEHIVQSTPHALTIIHGDVSPTNVILRPSGHLVIIDWTDARMDVGLTDLTQASHLFGMTYDVANRFFAYYNHPLNQPLFTSFQRYLCGIYDSVNASYQKAPQPLERLRLYEQELSLCLRK